MREGFTSFATCYRCGRHDFRDYFVLTDTTGHGERIGYACEPACKRPSVIERFEAKYPRLADVATGILLLGCLVAIYVVLTVVEPMVRK